jgi:hypothetical protein
LLSIPRLVSLAHNQHTVSIRNDRLCLREKDHIKENIGEIGLLLLERKGILSCVNELKYKTRILDSLEAKFKEYIRNHVVIKDSQKIDLSRRVYLDFFRRLCIHTNCENPNSPDSEPNKYTYSKWTFFTTNYDNCIEDFWVRSRGYSHLSLGFDQKNGKKIMNADRFVRRNTEESGLRSEMQLVKLHGSVNWIKYKNGYIEEHEYHTALDDIGCRSGSNDIQENTLIYPLNQKQLYFVPFLQFFRILNAELTKRNLWIIIGYSFRDIVIRTMFEMSLAENSKCKLLLVHPHATKQIKPLFRPRIRDQITCLDTYFAGRNYISVNMKIVKTLLTLSRS